MKLAIAVVLFFFFVVSMSSTSRAADVPRTVRLEVVRAPGAEQCPDADDFRDMVDVSAGVDMFDPKSTTRLLVTLTTSSSISRGRWEVIDAHGTTLRERSVTVPGPCTQLVTELAISWVVAYDTPTVAPPPAPAPCPPTCDEACRAQVREEMRRELLAAGYRPRMDGLSVAVLAGGLLSAGFTADPGGGFWLAGELHGEIFSGAIEARVLLPSRAVLEPSKHAFQITEIGAALVPCARWKYLLGCIPFDIGMLVAGSITTAPGAGPPIIATFGVGPRLALHIPFAERFGFRAFADLRFAPIPSGFAAQDTGATWQTGIVSGLFGAGLSFE